MLSYIVSISNRLSHMVEPAVSEINAVRRACHSCPCFPWLSTNGRYEYNTIRMCQRSQILAGFKAYVLDFDRAVLSVRQRRKYKRHLQRLLVVEFITRRT